MNKLKGFVSILLLASSAIAFAQAPEGVSEEQMQQMMQGMSQVASCFQNLDQQKMQAMVDRAQAKEKELKQWCAAGERSKAQREAMAFGFEYMNSDEFKQIKKCSEMAKGMMPELPDYSGYKVEDSEDYDNRHVCDEI